SLEQHAVAAWFTNADLIKLDLLRKRVHEFRPDYLPDVALAVEEVKQGNRRCFRPPQSPAMFQPVQQGRIETSQSGSQGNGIVDVESPVEHEHPGETQKKDPGNGTKEHKQRAIKRFPKVTLFLCPGKTCQLSLDACLIEKLHEVNLHQPHEHETFLDEGQLLCRPL